MYLFGLKEVLFPKTIKVAHRKSYILKEKPGSSMTMTGAVCLEEKPPVGMGLCFVMTLNENVCSASKEPLDASPRRTPTCLGCSRVLGVDIWMRTEGMMYRNLPNITCISVTLQKFSLPYFSFGSRSLIALQGGLAVQFVLVNCVFRVQRRLNRWFSCIRPSSDPWYQVLQPSMCVVGQPTTCGRS